MLKIKEWLTNKYTNRQYIISRVDRGAAVRLIDGEVIRQGVLYSGDICGESRLFEFMAYRPGEIDVHIKLFHSNWDDFRGTQSCEMNDIKNIKYVEG